jgi:hypothetical protein
MTSTRIGAFALPLITALAIAAPAAARETTLADRQARVRTTDRQLRGLLEEGMRESATLRALVDRLNTSDVVVYLQCDRAPPAGIDGRLTFVSNVGGFRYVVVRVGWRLGRDRQIAIVAHELQHAVEIAETPSIVDAASLAREYHRIGFVKSHAYADGVAFDTRAAMQAGAQVMRELTAAGAD